MTPTTYAFGAGIAAVTGIAITSETLTPGQTWTLVTILGAVLAGVAKAVHWICNRFVNQLDEQAKRMSGTVDENTKALNANTNVTQRLVDELRAQSQQQREFQHKLDEDREKAVDELKRALDAVPDRVAERIRRKGGT